ncbi:transmembrane signal receptor [Lithospermum erythrorhizon]|uniref:Transmembrane signal receptor n=1 Tax=Lithospermum erythrorhizon TaxID=34254 RepID=A0AAV3PDK9_LITER
MEREIQALEINNTWEIKKPDGSLDKYKTRLVAKGYNQIEGQHYYDSFSLVAKSVTVRIVLALATPSGGLLHQMDINNAFLHGFLDEEICMTFPEGYKEEEKPKVCKLTRSLYELKQASKQWNIKFTSKITEYGFRQSHHDSCLFIYMSGKVFLILVVYVDDILLIGTSEEEMIALKEFLHKQFTIKDLGLAKFFLGNEIARSRRGMFFTQ